MGNIIGDACCAKPSFKNYTPGMADYDNQSKHHSKPSHTIWDRL
jgi:hypothetical protein